jgi:hypothetical protein
VDNRISGEPPSSRPLEDICNATHTVPHVCCVFTKKGILLTFPPGCQICAIFSMMHTCTSLLRNLTASLNVLLLPLSMSSAPTKHSAFILVCAAVCSNSIEDLWTIRHKVSSHPSRVFCPLASKEHFLTCSSGTFDRLQSCQIEIAPCVDGMIRVWDPKNRQAEGHTLASCISDFRQMETGPLMAQLIARSGCRTQGLAVHRVPCAG